MTTLEQFNQKYKYKSDLEKYETSLFDIWEIPKLEDGIYYGDCESYCRFLKANIEWFKEWEYWYCKLEGVGHCVLIKDSQVIDCNIQRVVTLEEYSRLFEVTGFKKYSLLLVGLKIMFSKGFLLWKKFSK